LRSCFHVAGAGFNLCRSRRRIRMNVATSSGGGRSVHFSSSYRSMRRLYALRSSLTFGQIDPPTGRRLFVIGHCFAPPPIGPRAGHPRFAPPVGHLVSRHGDEERRCGWRRRPRPRCYVGHQATAPGFSSTISPTAFASASPAADCISTRPVFESGNRAGPCAV
jgi:hypothetical protein